MGGIDTLAIEVSSTFMNVASDSAIVPAAQRRAVQRRQRFVFRGFGHDALISAHCAKVRAHDRVRLGFGLGEIARRRHRFPRQAWSPAPSASTGRCVRAYRLSPQ